MKKVYILIGPKGCGKSHIGKLLHSNFGIDFLLIESLFLQAKKEGKNLSEQELGNLVENALQDRLKNKDSLSFETTASFHYFPTLLGNLKGKYNIKLIKILCSPEKCLERIRQRDISMHIPVDEEEIKRINKKSISIKLDFDFQINNDELSDEEIVTQLRKFLKMPQESKRKGGTSL